MSLRKFIQKSCKISFDTQDEFNRKFNALNASAEFPVSVDTNTIPDATDTSTWVTVHYYYQI